MIKFILLAVLLFSAVNAFSQTMVLKKADGTYQFIEITDIAELLFRSVTPCPGTPTVVYEGKTYHTVQIGSQCWLRENLNVGSKIDMTSNQTNNGTIEKYCYNDDYANCNIYGGLYQWDEAMQYITTPAARGICPEGWHIPVLSEFETLKAAVSGDVNSLMELGQGESSDNTSGFSAFMAGVRDSPFSGNGLGALAYFWSSTQYPSYSYMAYSMHLNNVLLDFFSNGDSKSSGESIRCVKD